MAPPPSATEPARPGPLIRLEDLTRIFSVGDQEVRALDGVDLGIRAGEYLSLMGPSGSGKSTLLNVRACSTGPLPASTGSTARPRPA
jgi:ABC-type lipoprotein export system ATPase subunit